MVYDGTKGETFFVKLYTRILKKSVYSHFVEWREDGVLLIHDIKALETTAFIHGVYIGHGGYPSIARQLRIYGFNRLLGRKYNGNPGTKVWKHESLTSTCSLLDVREYKRRAKPKGHNKRPPKTNETVIGLSRSCPSSSPCLEGLHSALPSSTDELQGPVSDVPGWSEPADQEHQDDGSSGKSFEEAFEDIAAIASGPEALDVMQEEIEKLTADIFAYLKEYS